MNDMAMEVHANGVVYQVHELVIRAQQHADGHVADAFLTEVRRGQQADKLRVTEVNIISKHVQQVFPSELLPIANELWTHLDNLSDFLYVSLYNQCAGYSGFTI